MSIGAILHHVHLSSPQPEALANFYAKAFGFEVRAEGGEWVCCAARRRIVLSSGPAHHIKHIAFAFPDATALAAYRASVGMGQTAPFSALIGAQAMSFVDPDGNRIVFIVAGDGAATAADAGPSSHGPRESRRSHGASRSGLTVTHSALPSAASQHLALRTTQPEMLLRFYEETLKFKLSDRVLDDAGVLRACFLRTDGMHHALALFRSPETRFDHQSFETTGWQAMREWADHMGGEYVPIVWGIGRHGPGNDNFFMVQDPDGNLGEISCDLEVCEAGRPAGVWPHAQHTLNLWGNAIMRS